MKSDGKNDKPQSVSPNDSEGDKEIEEITNVQTSLENRTLVSTRQAGEMLGCSQALVRDMIAEED